MSTTTARRGTHRPGGPALAAWVGLPLWAQTGLVFLALRAVSWLLLHLAAHQQAFGAQPVYPDGPGAMTADPAHPSLTLNWDAQWYERIAEHGYPSQLPVSAYDGEVQQNEWAFYPVFPLTARVVMAATGAGFAVVGPLLALAAGLGAAMVMAYLFRDTLVGATRGRAGALTPARAAGPAVGAVAVWAAFPSSPVLQMAYTESFAVLLLVTYLLLVVRRHWWAAGVVALVLGLTRPIALPLSVVVLVAAVLRWRQGRPDRRETTALAFAVVATGLSGLLWTAIAWAGTGRRDAYTATMASWRGGHALQFWEPWRTTIHYAWGYLRHDSPACDYSGCERIFIVPALSIVGALALALLVLVPRVAPAVDLRLQVWSAAYALYLLAVVDGGTSIVRYLVPLFPLALVAVGAHRSRGGRWVSPRWPWRTAFWVAAGILGQVGWIWWLVVFSPLPGGGDFPP